MESKKWIFEQLEQGKIRKIYDMTLNSLFERQQPDGYFPESFTGRYEGAFSRSIGAQALFLAELGRNEQAKKLLSFLFDTVKDYYLLRIPHWLTQDRSTIDMYDQIDGAAHCILAYASVCLLEEDPEFEERYYAFAKKEVITYYSKPYFMDDSPELPALCEDWEQYEEWGNAVLSTAPVFHKDALNLVQNFNFEHSRERHYWHCYDMLTQSFVGAAADQMILLAQKRNDVKLVSWLLEKVRAHRYGVSENLTFLESGKKRYLEMRVPTEDNPKGVPYQALGWPCIAPIAAEWRGCDPDIFRETIDYILTRTTIKDPVSKAKVNMVEYLPDGRISPESYGKVIGWYIEYYQRTQNWDGIAEWFRFLNENAGEGLLSETFIPMDAGGNMLIADDGTLKYMGDLPNDICWKITDGGNGEQSIWFCRAMYRLCKELGVGLSEFFSEE